MAAKGMAVFRGRSIVAIGPFRAAVVVAYPLSIFGYELSIIGCRILICRVSNIDLSVIDLSNIGLSKHTGY